MLKVLDGSSGGADMSDRGYRSEGDSSGAGYGSVWDGGAMGTRHWER